MLDDLKMIHQRDALDTLGRAAKRAGKLQVDVLAWLPEVPTRRNQAKQLAQELMGRSVAVYSGAGLAPAARRWKKAINIYAKQLAWAGKYDGSAYGELLAWTAQPLEKPYAVVELRSSFETPEVQNMFAVAARMLSGRRPEALEVVAAGSTPQEQLRWAAVLGEFTAIYLALLNGVNPAANPLKDMLSKEKTP